MLDLIREKDIGGLRSAIVGPLDVDGGVSKTGDLLLEGAGICGLLETTSPCTMY